MKKNLVLVLVTMMMIEMFSPGFVLAGDARVDGDGNATGINITDTDTNTNNNANDLNQDQWMRTEQDQNQGQSLVNNSKYLGSLPQASTHTIGTAVTPMNEYGHLVTQMGFGPGFCGEAMTKEDFRTMIAVMEKTNGAEKWSEIDEKIVPSPVIKRQFSTFGENEPVYFFPQEMVSPVLSRLSDKNLAGIWVYNSELDKDNPVLGPHFKARANMDARSVGANVVVPFDQFFQGYFVPEGTEFSIGGLLSGIASSFTRGASIAGNVGIARQQNTEFGRPGAAFIFLRVENPMDLCRVEVIEEVKKSPTPVTPAPCDPNPIYQKIKDLEEKIKLCKKWGIDNMRLRFAKANAYAELAICTVENGYFSEAIKDYQLAEKNYLNGEDISANRTEADSLLGQVYYNWSGCVSEISGSKAAEKFAMEKNMKKYSNGFVR